MRMLFRNVDNHNLVTELDLIEQIRRYKRLDGNYILVSVVEGTGRGRKRRRRYNPPSANDEETGSMADYLDRSRTATEECVRLLQAEPYLERHVVEKNIYCPYHEDRRTSSTPSGKLYVKTHTFRCFSTRCKRRSNSLQLLRYLKQKKDDDEVKIMRTYIIGCDS